MNRRAFLASLGAAAAAPVVPAIAARTAPLVKRRPFEMTPAWHPGQLRFVPREHIRYQTHEEDVLYRTPNEAQGSMVCAVIDGKEWLACESDEQYLFKGSDMIYYNYNGERIYYQVLGAF